jgi:hypothetical protein
MNNTTRTVQMKVAHLESISRVDIFSVPEMESRRSRARSPSDG